MMETPSRASGQNGKRLHLGVLRMLIDCVIV